VVLLLSKPHTGTNFVPAIGLWGVKCRVTTCLENLEMSGNLTVIGEMSWIFSGGATPGRARSNALAKNILSRLAPWLTEIFTFGHSQSLQLMICLTTVLTCK